MDTEKIRKEITRRYKGIAVKKIADNGEILVLKCEMGKRNVSRYISNYIFKNFKEIKAVHFEHPTENYLWKTVVSYAK